MALPKFSELSPAVQGAVILGVGALLFAGLEYVWLQPVKITVTEKETKKTALDKEVEPLRPYVQRLPRLVAENKQLEAQLENLKRIVPNEKEVDNFVRQVQGEALTAGVMARRFTAKPAVTQEYYVEVPFEVELDGPFYDVLQFYDRLSKLERIINVSELKMGGIEAKKSVGQKQYAYSPNETVAAICIVTTFFSKEGEEPEEPVKGKPGAPARAPAPRR